MVIGLWLLWKHKASHHDPLESFPLSLKNSKVSSDKERKSLCVKRETEDMLTQVMYVFPCVWSVLCGRIRNLRRWSHHHVNCIEGQVEAQQESRRALVPLIALHIISLLADQNRPLHQERPWTSLYGRSPPFPHSRHEFPPVPAVGVFFLPLSPARV